MANYANLAGKKIGKWTVIKLAENYISPDGTQDRQWLCRCECGTEKAVRACSLTSRKSLSCGCGRIEKIKAINNWELNMNDNIAICNICNTKNNIKFIINIEDWVRCKEYSWFVSSYGGYNAVMALIDGHITSLHRFLMNCPDDKVVDHINGDTTDNRKSNLRICTVYQNTLNHKKANNNTSGITGVYSIKNKWTAAIGYNKKSIHLGTFNTKEEAVKARKEAEEKYFGEFKREG